MQLFRKVPVVATGNGDVALQEIALPVSFEYSNAGVNANLAAGAPRLVFGAVILGVLAGVAASAYWWKNRVRAEILQATPLERVEELIASCESKIEDIERTIENLKGSNP